VNSSLITGNRELTDVIAHEITHSWSGNLVTNSSWPDFWLNEGFTMYIERLILRAVAEKKEPGTGDKTRDFAACLGYGELISTVNSLKEQPELTKLIPDMRGIDPDDAFSRIPYEKGCLLLIYLESRVGGISKMIPWLHKYFATFARQSIDTADMIKSFEDHFGKELNIDWDTWLYGTGRGPWNPMEYLDQTWNKNAQSLANKWLQQNGDGASPNDIKWDAALTMVFLDNILNSEQKLSAETLQKLNTTYQLSESKNVEVLWRYLRICLQSEHLQALPDVEKFVSIHGRGVYVKSLYKHLIDLAEAGVLPKDKVKQIYQKNRLFYHSVIRNAFDSQLL
jgi:leukotriene-A4 hydrolase